MINKLARTVQIGGVIHRISELENQIFMFGYGFAMCVAVQTQRPSITSSCLAPLDKYGVAS